MENKIQLISIENKIKNILSSPNPNVLKSKQMSGGKYIIDNNITLTECIYYDDIEGVEESRYFLEIMGIKLTDKFTQKEIKFLYNILVSHFENLDKEEKRKEEEIHTLKIIEYLNIIK